MNKIQTVVCKVHLKYVEVFFLGIYSILCSERFKNIMVFLDCEKFADCIQCIKNCKYYFVVLQNTSELCLKDPAAASAPVIGVFNDTTNCQVPIDIDSGTWSPIIFGILIGIFIVVGIGIWFYRNRNQMSNNEMCPLLQRQRRMTGIGTETRFYDLDRQTESIEMDSFPNPTDARLMSEDGMHTEPAILEFDNGDRKNLIESGV